MNDQAPVKAAIWARVSTTDQHTENQVHVLREWAAKRGFEVVTEFVTEDSAWKHGVGPKGKEFDWQRRLLVAGAKAGDYQRVLIWSLDRLSRRGIRDTIGVLEDLDDAGAVVCSHQQDWLETGDPRMRQLVISVMAWMAEMESAVRSERTKLGQERARREGKTIGGSRPGRKQNKTGQRLVAKAGWEGETGEARKAGLIAKNIARGDPEKRAEREAAAEAKALGLIAAKQAEREARREEKRREELLEQMRQKAILRGRVPG